MFTSAIDVYKEMSQGSAQINPLSDFFQETETKMKSEKPIFEGEGYSTGYGVFAYPFDTEQDTYDYTKPPEFDFAEPEQVAR